TLSEMPWGQEFGRTEGFILYEARAGHVLEDDCTASSSPGLAAPGTSARLSTRPRVLIVEDDAFVAMEIAQVLDAAGFDVAGPVGRTAAALELLKRKGCDAAVLDINLGAESSESIAAALIEHGTPFVTLSGYALEQYPSVFMSAPAFTKPLRPQLLIAELRKCIAQKAQKSVGQINHAAEGQA